MSSTPARAKPISYISSDAKLQTWWACYNCGARLVSATAAALQDREIWTCRGCNLPNALGRGVRVDRLRQAHGAISADAAAAPLT